ncbi:FasE domain protein [Escherichia coli]|nr:FasE domain protein [Escherichia coli]
MIAPGEYHIQGSGMTFGSYKYAYLDDRGNINNGIVSCR